MNKKNFRQGLLSIMLVLSCSCIVGSISNACIRSSKLMFFIWGILFTVLVIDTYAIVTKLHDDKTAERLLAENIALMITTIEMVGHVKIAKTLEEAQEKVIEDMDYVTEKINVNDRW